MLITIPAFDPRPQQDRQSIRRSALNFARSRAIDQLFPSLGLLVRAVAGWVNDVLSFLC